jgi:translocation and assembly module TamA
MRGCTRGKPGTKSRVARCLAVAALLFAAANSIAGELQYAVRGVDDPLKANVLAHMDKLQLGREARLTPKDYPDVIADAQMRARRALRPFGYYAPTIDGSIEQRNGKTLLLLSIQPGPPMRVTESSVAITGEGSELRELRRWREEWPLRTGTILNQAVWEERKLHAIESAASSGFLDARFTEQVLELDLNENTAAVRLVLDTGPQYVFGDIDFGVHSLKPGILEFIPRFTKGEPYNTRMLDTFRIDLWRTGYFTDINMEEVRQEEMSPRQVDLVLNLETAHKNSYQGSLGFGTDTGARVQAQWSRHPMSKNGDRLDLGLGWQEQDDEWSSQSNYRLPRPTRERPYSTAQVITRLERLDLAVTRSFEDDESIDIASGKVTEFHIRLGRLKVRNLKSGDRQFFGTLFVQHLFSKQVYDSLYDGVSIPSTWSDQLDFTDNAYSLGFNADILDVNGKGFETVGRHDSAWIFASNTALGSEVDFAQAYIGSRRIYRFSERWKLLLRGEIGYTQATVNNVKVDTDSGEITLSATELPNFYRFKAGGSNSVRGYGFESLSTNNIGSNHIITASIEAEYRIRDKWSVAAFVDAGNAFNNWSKPSLRKGAGIGIRWYSIAGPVSIDFAWPLDIEGKPWRLHFTIGTRLL